MPATVSLPSDDVCKRSWFWPILGGIAIVGLVIRVLFIALKTAKLQLIGDAAYYFLQAKYVAAGKGFLHPYYTVSSGHPVPGADHPPGFVVLLAFFDKIGLNTPSQQRYALAVLGTLTVVVIALLARRLIGDRGALIAATLAAIYPQIWINDGMLMSETLYLFAVVCALWYCYSLWERPTTGAVIGAALTITVACSARPESILLFPILLIPVILGRKTWRASRRVAMIGLSGAICVLVLLPWVVYNQSRFSKPVYLSTGLGQTLASMNCDLTYSGQTLGFYNRDCSLQALAKIQPSPDSTIVDSRLTKVATSYIKNHKRQLPKVILAREGRIWGVFRPTQQAGFDGWLERRGGFTISMWATRAYWVIALGALAGIFIWRRRKIPLYPLMAQLELTAFTAALTCGITRYRAGAEVSLVLLAAAAIDWAIGRVRHRSSTVEVSTAPLAAGNAPKPVA